MKLIAILTLLLSYNGFVAAQDTPAVAVRDTAKQDFFKLYQWKEKSKGEFEMVVPGYDSLRMGTNSFQNFYYITKDKPDGKLTVRDENGKKVRECIYKNKLMVEEHWWFPGGEKEFDGYWSSIPMENGDQWLMEYKWYYRNKKVRKHGYHTGITTTYYQNGVKESEKTFLEGKPNGPYKEYFPDGKIQCEGQYADGNKTGEWIYYNMDGSVLERNH